MVEIIIILLYTIIFIGLGFLCGYEHCLGNKIRININFYKMNILKTKTAKNYIESLIIAIIVFIVLFSLMFFIYKI